MFFWNPVKTVSILGESLIVPKDTALEVDLIVTETKGVEEKDCSLSFSISFRLRHVHFGPSGVYRRAIGIDVPMKKGLRDIVEDLFEEEVRKPILAYFFRRGIIPLRSQHGCVIERLRSAIRASEEIWRENIRAYRRD